MLLIVNLYFELVLCALIVGRGLCQTGDCPNAAELFPYCACNIDTTQRVVLDCSRARNEDQLDNIFTTTTFPTHDVYSIEISNNNDLISLTRNVFGNVTFQFIYFSNVVIQYIDESVFAKSNSTLTEWNISWGKLELDGFPFQSLYLYTTLESLYLYSAGTFIVLPSISSTSLTSIRINYCQLETMPQQSLQELPNLLSLDVRFNNISSLSPELFANNSMLNTIDLCNNNLEEILAGIFKNIEYLTKLYLCNNSISYIEAAAFFGIPKLEVLDLSTNNLQHLLFSSLGILPSLQTLFIEENNIKYLDIDLFDFCPNVTNVFAFRNELTSIGAEVFDAMVSGVLNLDDNLLTTLEQEWLWQILLNQNFVSIYGNPLECGCDMAWIFENNSTLLTNLYGNCGNGTDIRDLNPSFYLDTC